ncbi:MAG: hypothetical protein GTO71_09195 [Woeseiaceae bacterium]|nr:hypothetical protein [Woeseiaceae bacterium]NIP21261.1 hypothetical protein [Woeseiaceae bacterium]NIS90233.1 hypothetical protein [Woeseiaceae bacterium]
MIALPNRGPNQNVLPLLRTLFEIVLLRKGPESIPHSTVLFALIVGFWFLSSAAVLALIEQYDQQDFIVGIFTAMVGLGCYAVTVVVAGFPTRVLQTMSAILGCGALISFAFVAEFVLFTPFLGQTITGLVAQLILLWSVPVEGHIIARAINRHWYIGIVIAIVVFILQYVIYRSMTVAT